jgi:peptidoglycan/LPS O-acetylase OafA/YrhL
LGVYRLLLSIVVVFFHYGGGPPLAGRIAVYGFFVISGYLMALVIDRAYGYSVGGAGRFYLNRLLRLGPLFLFYTLLSLALVESRHQAPFFSIPTDPGKTYFGEIGGAFFGHFVIAFHPFITIAGVGGLIPQSWSLLVEAFFYVCAPFFALLFARGRLVFFAIFLASVGFQIWVLNAGYTFDGGVYQNYAAAASIFMSGMMLYYWRDKIGRLLPHPAVIGGIAAAVVGWCAMNIQGVVLPFYLLLIVCAIATAALGRVRTWPKPLAGLERWAGDLAYGVFLNHFLAAAILSTAAEHLYASGGNLQPFGRPSTPEFGWWVVALSILMSLLTLFLIERPLEGVRDRVRRTRVRDKSTPTTPSSVGIGTDARTADAFPA